jgi:TPR repeat protein
MGSSLSSLLPTKPGDGSKASSAVHARPNEEAFERLASKLPNVIDDESRQQVEDYRQACNDGKGPMAACFATGEYLSLYERKHKEAADLYRNVCFRDKTDKSINGVLVDGTKAYPSACFNLAKMTMTGQGLPQIDNAEFYSSNLV